MKIYLVKAYMYNEYGPEEEDLIGVVQAFAKNEDAKSFIEECIEYNTTAPLHPSLINLKGSYKRLELDIHINQNREWQDNHPADGYSGADFYHVDEMELN